MRLATIRASLALMVVGVFMGITAFMAIFPLLSPTNITFQAYGDYFAKTASVYTGMVGVVIGYYFGRSQDREIRQGEPRSEPPERDRDS